jgi:hypothetical protein
LITVPTSIKSRILLALVFGLLLLAMGIYTLSISSHWDQRVFGIVALVFALLFFGGAYRLYRRPT